MTTLDRRPLKCVTACEERKKDREGVREREREKKKRWVSFDSFLHEIFCSEGV